MGAYGGRRDLMSKIAPEGPIYQAGTLSGNPLAVAAGIACLTELAGPGVYGSWRTQPEAGGRRRAPRRMRPGCRSPSTGWAACGPPSSPPSPSTTTPRAKKADTAKFGRFFHALLDRGVYLPPSQFESAFNSTAHGPAELEHTLLAVRAALRSL